MSDDANDRRRVVSARLEPLTPAQTVTFTFDGRTITARSGEPLSAALIAAGVRVFRTMPHTGEARGGYCLVGRCTDCLVVVDGRPNVRACVTPVRAGMAVATQRGLGEDAWNIETGGDEGEPAAPLAHADRDRLTGSVQVAVVGGGPAGLSAAIAAATAGARTVLIDEQAAPGGQLRYRSLEIAPDAAAAALRPAALAAALRSEAEAAGVDLRSGTVAWGLFEADVLGVADERSAYLLRPDVIVLATGSTDRPLPLAGGSLPGVLSARAVQILLNRDRVLPGRRFAVLGTGDEAATVAAEIRLAGGDVIGPVDPGDGRAVSATGSDGVQAISIDGRHEETDVVVVAVGRQPDAALALMAGCAFGFDSAGQCHVPVLDDDLGTTDPRLLVAGDAAGVTDVATALAEGRFAGISAAAKLGLVDAAALGDARRAYQEACPERVAGRRRLRPTYVQRHE